MSRRYVVMVSLNDKYLPERETDSLQTAEEDALAMYKRMDYVLEKKPGQATISIFDRDEDRLISCVWLTRYPKEVQA